MYPSFFIAKEKLDATSPEIVTFFRFPNAIAGDPASNSERKERFRALRMPAAAMETSGNAGSGIRQFPATSEAVTKVLGPVRSICTRLATALAASLLSVCAFAAHAHAPLRALSHRGCLAARRHSSSKSLPSNRRVPPGRNSCHALAVSSAQPLPRLAGQIPSRLRVASSSFAVSLHLNRARDASPRGALSGRFWIGGQANVIAQGHAHFYAAYSGPNSFRTNPEAAVTSIEDFFSGFRVTRRLSVLFDVEDVRGDGLSNVLGLAGFTDLDAQKAPSAGSQPNTYMSRFLLHYVLPLGHAVERNDPNYLELGRELPSRRLEIYFGKFSLADFFDRNRYANSSHSQFMNWTTDQSGVWDYAANTPGYTYGAYLEFDSGPWSLRYAEVLMTRVPNGLYLSTDIPNTRSANAQINWAYSRSTHGKIRLLGFVQQAPMGSFANALAAWHDGVTPVPEVSAVRHPDAHEYGFGLNWQQALPDGFGLFARAGWNNGKYESYSYTEVNNAVEAGLQIPGKLWKRARDHAGLAFASNGISRLHQEYLAAGGLGFQLGDGALTYGREQILEAYYNLQMPLGLSFGPDVQYIANPGYNRARGPVTVFGLRLHLHLGFHQID
jgi:hypothetical protein